MSYYHYPKGIRLPQIVKDGFIKLSTAGIEKREKPAAWLTMSPEWDASCNVGQILNQKNLEACKAYSSNEIESVTVNNDYMKKEIGMCRIVISETIPTISWAKFKYVSGISERMYNALDHFLWQKTFTQYKVAFAYEKEMVANYETSIQ